MEEGWRAVVNVRQEHVSHLRTFFHLEQIGVTTNLADIEPIRRIKYNIDEGLSFCFMGVCDAWDFVELITDLVPARYRIDRISPGDRCFFSVEIVPICCGDLIFLPPSIAASLGPNIIGPIVICTRVARTFTLLDPFTLTHCFLKSDQYWNAPFTPSFTTTNLVEYVVLDILLQDNEVDEEEKVEEKKVKKLIIENSDEDDSDAADAAAAKKYRLADAVVARVKDIGNNDTTFQIKTHLGRILKPGDYAIGYDLSRGVEGGANGNLPAAILIAKTSYDEENGRVVVAHDKWESDYQLFLKDLQQDTKLIFNIGAAYRKQNNPSKRPFVPLQDLLDG